MIDKKERRHKKTLQGAKWTCSSCGAKRGYRVIRLRSDLRNQSEKLDSWVLIGQNYLAGKNLREFLARWHPDVLAELHLWTSIERVEVDLIDDQVLCKTCAAVLGLDKDSQAVIHGDGSVQGGLFS